MDVLRFKRLFDQIAANVNTVIHGKEDVVRLALIAICANGHILFEDVPGVGKSMLARALGQSINAKLARVQCTPDMLPGDITGSSIIDTQTMSFSFRPGPVFANILLVDEINRATPKTQSALLEAMAERNVTVDGVTRPLPAPFLVLATQNPVELAGTFPLPEAQLDRFLFKLNMGYPDLEAERMVMEGNAVTLEVEGLEAVIDAAQVMDMIALGAEVQLPRAVSTFILEITHATRDEPSLLLGAGPRASISLLKASKVAAAADGRDTVYPEDVKALLRPILAHRLMRTPDAVLRGESIDDILDRVTSRVKPPMGVRSAQVTSPSSSALGASTGSTSTDDASPDSRGRRRRSKEEAGTS